MTKYVDVDALLERLPNDLPYKASVKRVLMQAEGVEVVRCKDCKWWHNEIDCRNTSGLYRFVPNGNWFCASGERK